MEGENMKKVLIRLGAFLIIVLAISLAITWHIFYLPNYDPYNAEPGSVILNSDKYQDGDIVNIEGVWKEIIWTGGENGIIYLDTMILDINRSNENRVVTYVPIYLEEHIEMNDIEASSIVIRCRVEGNGTNKTIIGLEVFTSYEYLYEDSLSLEILLLLVASIIYFLFTYKFLEKEFAQVNSEQNDIAEPPAPSR